MFGWTELAVANSLSHLFFQTNEKYFVFQSFLVIFLKKIIDFVLSSMWSVPPYFLLLVEAFKLTRMRQIIST